MPVTSDPHRRDRLAGGLLLLALPLLAAGLAMPAVSITHLGVFTDTYSIAGTALAFWSNEKYLLFAVVLFFSLLFPTAKILIALWAWCVRPGDGESLHRLCGYFNAVSKWSMLDVFIVALTVLALEGSLISAADVHLGVVLFAVSVIASTVALQRLARGAIQQRANMDAANADADDTE